MIICRRQRSMIERCQMHAFRSYIFAARIACDSGPTCQLYGASAWFTIQPVYGRGVVYTGPLM